MKIEYLGHSCFKLTNGEGASVVCDPYSPEIGYSLPLLSADAVTVSHHHFDHDYLDCFERTPLVLDREGRFGFKGILFHAIKSFHDDVKGKKRGGNLIFEILMDGITVCHLGDLGEKCSERLTEKISKVDVLLIPVGGNYTIGAKTAKLYVDKIKPQIVIPMHYSTPDSKIDIKTADDFLKQFDKDCIAECDNFEFSKNDLDGNNTKIIVLRRAE